MSNELACMIYRHFREKIEDQRLKQAVKILTGPSMMVFDEFPIYKPYPNHSFSIISRGNNIYLRPLTPDQKVEQLECLVKVFHDINDEEYDSIEFFPPNEYGEILFEYHASDRLSENIIHRKNYPDEWEMFSDEMPWDWFFDQLKLLAIKHV